MAWIVVLVLFLGGCSLPAIPPGFLTEEIDHTVTFETLLEHPSAVEGKSIVLGGELLSIETTEKGMMLNVLELPLTDSLAPVLDHAQSRGDFLLFDPDAQDSEKLALGSRLTIVGKVKGTVPDTKEKEGGPKPLLIAERIATWPSWPAPSAFGPFATNCGPFRGFWPFGGSEPFTGRIYPTC